MELDPRHDAAKRRLGEQGRVPTRGGKAGLTGVHPWWRGGTLGGACGRRLPRAEEQRRRRI